jgi:hypothetical protein
MFLCPSEAKAILKLRYQCLGSTRFSAFIQALATFSTEVVGHVAAHRALVIIRKPRFQKPLPVPEIELRSAELSS